MFIVLVLLFGATVTTVGVRDHRRLRSQRMPLLDDAARAVDDPVLSHGGDGFPKLSGLHTGSQIIAELIPDTMVVRRLPQLWLSVTLISPNKTLPAFGVLVRHSGNEFYALTPQFAERLEPARGFPNEVFVRGQGAGAQQLLDELREPLATLLADPHIKEVAITPKGLRIVRQAAEGRRGDHLLLRQANFDLSRVPPEDLTAIIDQLRGLEFAIMRQGVKAA